MLALCFGSFSKQGKDRCSICTSKALWPRGCSVSSLALLSLTSQSHPSCLGAVAIRTWLRRTVFQGGWGIYGAPLAVGIRGVFKARSSETSLRPHSSQQAAGHPHADKLMNTGADSLDLSWEGWWFRYENHNRGVISALPGNHGNHKWITAPLCLRTSHIEKLIVFLSSLCQCDGGTHSRWWADSLGSAGRQGSSQVCSPRGFQIVIIFAFSLWNGWVQNTDYLY